MNTAGSSAKANGSNALSDSKPAGLWRPVKVNPGAGLLQQEKGCRLPPTALKTLMLRDELLRGFCEARVNWISVSQPVARHDHQVSEPDLAVVVQVGG